jgi:hypothetical protein
MITEQDIMKKRDEILLTTTDIHAGLQQLFAWLTANDNNMDPAAKKYSKQFFDTFFKLAEKSASAMTESPEKRKAIRLAKSGLDQHQSAKQLLQGLESSPLKPDQVLNDWSEIVLKSTQVILDLLFDVVQVKQQGKVRVVTIALFYSCIDELTAAHALARHSYFAQANSHLRTVIETLDKIELFVKDSKWVDLWSSGDGKAIWKELRPKQVRLKLGKDGEDPLYSHLSGSGSHPTFRSFQDRAVNRIGEDGTKIAHIFVAGTKLEHVRMFYFSLALTVINLVISRLLACYSSMLNEEEVIGFLKESIGSFKKFNETHFLPWARENKLEADEIAQFIGEFDLESESGTDL